MKTIQTQAILVVIVMLSSLILIKMYFSSFLVIIMNKDNLSLYLVKDAPL